ncbi:MAG: CRISPR-associated endonuclease Cas2 [Patescibacteria group bacterium]
MSSKRAGAQAGREVLLDLLELILKKSDIDRALTKKLYYARRMGYVQKSSVGDLLTQKGRILLTEGKVWNLTIPTPRRWDGRWRLVVFDIPVDKHKRRDSFRRRLQELGLTLYQNSVWVYPYPLEEIIRKIADFYKLSSCVSFIVAEDLTDEYKLMKRYNLS